MGTGVLIFSCIEGLWDVLVICWNRIVDASMMRCMPILAPLPDRDRKPGNPNWGRPMPAEPVVPTEFERETQKLRLTAEMYVTSTQLRTWCERNRHRCFVPEWLLKEWHFSVDPLMFR